jgi:hypothetical protein
MRCRLERWLVCLLALVGPPAFAQPAVPEIPFKSVPDFLKLPPDLYLGEATGVAVDSRGHVFMFSRGNSTGPAYGAAAAQLLEFGPDGEFLRAMAIDAPVGPDARPAIGNKPDLSGYMANMTMAPGAPWTVCITPPPNQVLYTSDAFPGRVYKMSLDGKMLGMLGTSGKQLKQFGWVHAIACPSENEIYVAEILNWRVQKLILHPDRRKASSR